MPKPTPITIPRTHFSEWKPWYMQQRNQLLYGREVSRIEAEREQHPERLQALAAAEQLRLQGGWHGKDSLNGILRWPTEKLTRVVNDLVSLGLLDPVERRVKQVPAPGPPDRKRSSRNRAGRSWPGKLRTVRAQCYVISAEGHNLLKVEEAEEAGLSSAQGLQLSEQALEGRARRARQLRSVNGDPVPLPRF